MSKRRVRELVNLRLREVSVVDAPANRGAQAILFKSLAGASGESAGEPSGVVTEPAPAAAPEDTSALADARKELAAKDAALALAVEKLAALRLKMEAGASVEDLEKQSMTTTPAAPDQAAIEKAVAEAVAKATATLKAEAEAAKAAAQAAEQRAEKAEQAAQAEKAARELADLTKRVEAEFPTLPGQPVTKAAAIGAVEKMDGPVKDALLAMLKAGEAAMKQVASGRQMGTSAVPPASGSAGAELDALAKTIQTAKSVSFAKAYDEALSQRPDLYARYMAEQRARAVAV